MNKQRQVLITTTYNEMGIIVDIKAEKVEQPNLQPTCNQLATDCISRQQTITALRALSDEDGYISAPHEVVTDVVRGLPPVRAEQGQTTHSERGETDKLASKMGGTWVDVTCPNCGCEIHVESEIIKCGDCKYTDGCEPIEDGRYWCCLHESFMYYCSDAERREDG